MATIDDAIEMITSFPEVTEGVKYGRRSWLVAGKMFAWERPLTKADVKRWGDAPLPEGDILAVRVEDLAEKEAVLQAGHPGFFTMQHFDGYPSFLIELRKARKKALREAIEDAWLAEAPQRLIDEHLAR